MGGDLSGSGEFQWYGGVLAPNGKIYGIPRNASRVLCIDPATEQATLVGGDLSGSGDNKWVGGVLAPNGKIYGIPRDASRVLCISTTIPTNWTLGLEQKQFPPYPTTDAPDAAPDAAGAETGGIPDMPKGVDRLGYTIYAKALAQTARQAESPTASLAVGLYARWGGGKSFLWHLILSFLKAEVIAQNAHKLHHQALAKLPGAAHAFRLAAQEVQENAYIDQSAKTSVAQLEAPEEKLHDTSRLAERRKTRSALSQLSTPEAFVMHLLAVVDASSNLTRSCCQRSAAKSEEKAPLLGGDKGGLAKGHKLRVDRARQAVRDESRAALLILFFPLLLLLCLVHACLARFSNVKLSKIHPAPDAEPTKRDTEAAARQAQAAEARRVLQLLHGKGKNTTDASNSGCCTSAAAYLRYSLLLFAESVLSLVEPATAWLHAWVISLSARDYEAPPTPECMPEGETEYIFVDFNAWVFSGSDLLWASLVKAIYDEVESTYGARVVREYRLRCALSGESPNDSQEEKERKRGVALRRYQVSAGLRTALGLILAAALWFGVEQLLRVIVCPASDDDAGAITDFCACSDPSSSAQSTAQTLAQAAQLQVAASNSTASSIDTSAAIGTCIPPLMAAMPGLLVTILPSVLVSLYPLVRHVYQHFTTIRPYLRESQGEAIAKEASATSKKADMSAELGFMHKVRTEILILYDFLRTTHRIDEEKGVRRLMRLLVFIDDLDRCPKDVVVKVLEAIILLLVEAPISTCYLAIDSRVVATSIEDAYGTVFSKAGISGYEFLEKIVQLPCTELPAR